MANIECHGCLRAFDESEARWYKPFGGGATRRADGGLDTYSTLSSQPEDGAVPYCPTCAAEILKNAE